jgi:PAS domain-containing serine/threonine kinase
MFAIMEPQLEGGNVNTACVNDIPSLLDNHLSISQKIQPPAISRRPSHDLFECIEQSENRCLTEAQARYVFAQVVDAVHYLDTHGITHRDIKDENLVIDNNLKVLHFLSLDELLLKCLLVSRSN